MINIRGLIVVIIVLAYFISYAYPRDNGQYASSPLKSWFDGLRSGKGPCCSDADGSVVKDSDWIAVKGHYKVFLDGEWINVEDSAVITEPNLYGHTMVWPYKGSSGTVIRCFIPGALI